MTTFLDQSRPAIADLAKAVTAGDARAGAGRSRTRSREVQPAIGALRLAASAGRSSESVAAGREADTLRQQEELEHVYEMTATALRPGARLEIHR